MSEPTSVPSSENELTPDTCYNALRVVIDPEIYQNIVDLGLVYGVDVHEDRAVDVTMTLTTPHCPMGPQIIENVEKALIDFGAASVKVNIVWEPMWTPEAMTDELKQELGILDAATTGPEEDEEEPQLEIDPPPPLPEKKKGLLGRIFGR